MNTNYMDISDCDNPIDLSRRCDSVETCKTPSPSTTTLSSSPSTTNSSVSSLENESPTSNQRHKKASIRSTTPPNGYQTTAQYVDHTAYSTAHLAYNSVKRPQSSAGAASHRHYLHEPQQIHVTNDDIDRNILHAVSLQQKLKNIPATISPKSPSSPESSSNLQFPMIINHDDKLTRIARPFKVYSDQFANLLTSMPTSDSPRDRRSAEKFSIFRQQQLEQIHAINGGPTVTNPKMRRTSVKNNNQCERNEQQHHENSELQSQISCPSDSSEAGSCPNGKAPIKDSAYYERRRKNNAAAKKSRDRRRMKEDEIAIRNSFLERENLELRIKLEATERQLAQFL